jgi:hypothetical protein
MELLAGLKQTIGHHETAFDVLKRWCGLFRVQHQDSRSRNPDAAALQEKIGHTLDFITVHALYRQ